VPHGSDTCRSDVATLVRVSTRVTLTPRGPFSLAAGIGFLEGWSPAAYEGDGSAVLRMAFPSDRTWRPTAAVVRQPEADRVEAEVVADGDLTEADAGIVRGQIERILSLDVDGSGFPAVGDRDPVVAGLQARYPGLRPVCFWSPYEAAAWTVIVQRMRIVQAAAIKARMARELGTALTIDGHRVHAFPGPDALAAIESFPGLTGVKIDRLHGVASAALAGALDPTALRAVPRTDALASLRTIPGIGPFSSELILLRGAGDPDARPTAEPRFGRAVERAYGLAEAPDETTLTGMSDAWRPYRTWVTLLLRAAMEDDTGEIRGKTRA
jgi:DNA-3-methyladenine glycosylase II